MAESYAYDREPKGKGDRARYWNDQIRRARGFEETWRNRCYEIIDRYRRSSEAKKVSEN